MKVFFRIFFVSYLLFNSCTSDTEQRQEVSSEKKIVIDSNSVPVFAKPEIISGDSNMRIIARLLTIPEIQGKPKNEEYRIWINSSKSDSGKIVQIRRENGMWSSKAFYYKAKVDTNGIVRSVGTKIESNEPKEGWEAFLNKSFLGGIKELRQYSEIKDYHLCNDGMILSIETWKDNLHKTFDYPCFDQYLDKLEPVKRIKSLCLLIQEQFGYRLFPAEF